MPELNYDQFIQSSRTNGWDCPWHALQVLAWTITFYFIAIFFGCFAPNLVSPWDVVSNIITAVSTLGLMVTLMAATTLDPADPSVRAKGGNKNMPRLDRTKNKHAIENQTCALCQVIVGPKSKHCSACNKCVSGFDHHCRWLNNCVGDRNYLWFFASLIFGLMASLMVNIVGILLFVAKFTDEGNGDIVKVYKDAKHSNSSTQLLLFNNHVDEVVFLTVDAITVLLALTAFVLMLHLMQFHVWLMYKGLSTYDFIIREREKARVKQESSVHHHELSNPSARSQPLKANRITPSKPPEKKFSRSEEDEVKQYQKALAEKERMDGGETPPPLASPIYRDEKIPWKKGNGEGDGSTVVRKMKKKKKKKFLGSHTSNEMQISTLDNYNHQAGDVTFSDADNTHHRQKHSSGSWKNGASLDHPYRASFDRPTADARLSPITSPISGNAIDAAMGASSADGLSINGTVDELNTTTMFTVNTDANLNPDGSLSYEGRFRSLPLTPIPKQKWRGGEEVPPLDLSALRASTDSSNSYKPYTGTTRSTDTYRFPIDQRALPPLKTLPESLSDNKEYL